MQPTQVCYITPLPPLLFLSLCTFLPSVLSAVRGARPGHPTGPGAFWRVGAETWNSGSKGTTGDSWSNRTPTRLPVHGVIPRHPDLILSQLHDQHHPQLSSGRLDLWVGWSSGYSWFSVSCELDGKGSFSFISELLGVSKHKMCLNMDILGWKCELSLVLSA